MGEENGTSPFFGNVTWVEIFGDVTSVVFGNVTSMAKPDFFGDVTANRQSIKYCSVANLFIMVDYLPR